MNKKRFMRLLSAVSLLSGMLVFNAASAFQMQSMDASRVDLLDYVGQGSWTIVMFWSTDCVACEEQKPAFEAFHQEHNDGVANVVGVAIDGMENKDEIDVLMDLHDPTYPNLVAFTDVFHRQYQELVGKPFRITPTFLVFDRDGKLQGNLYGYIDFPALSQHVASH